MVSPESKRNESSVDLEKADSSIGDSDLIRRISTEHLDDTAHATDLAEKPQFHRDDDPELQDVEVLGEAAGLGSGIASRVSTRNSQATLAPPDGGLMAWSMCLCAHVVIANTWGVINSFGIFQAYYTDFLGISPSAISWIGAVQNFLGYALAMFSGRMSDAGYFRLTLLIGSVLLVLGGITMSFSHTYWQLMVTQGVLMGLGAGFLCCPIMSVTSTYFSSKRTIAVALVTCGNVTGGLIYPVMARQLLPSVGFGWSIRAITFMQAASLCIVLLVARARVKPDTTAPMVDFSALKESEFSFYTFGMFFAFSGLYVSLYYFSQYSRTAVHPNLSYQDSLNLILIFNGLSLVGRLIPSYLADRVGAVNIMAPTVFAICALTFGWIGVRTTAGIYSWIVVDAMVCGSQMGLFPGGIASLTTDLRKIGVRMGTAFAVCAFSVLVGPPVAGAILSSMAGRYVGVQAYSGALLFVGGCFVSGAKIARTESSEDQNS
ncbi:uncharacterized protein E0L32_010971 [Thyridium curvatum]|uniref:Major facilitator superfamily (MFS) profile domain-containing protein n=1 Tax=Thyridium curvatum TaxID=1093900 RepID=A0A507AL04_9PEZI|nr:uncharacterized protein E0L32_010971 [Thyridium curvatum]TPX07076.1 hypothetical protein E0L32_010971 [Thyridium curvatum]